MRAAPSAAMIAALVMTFHALPSGASMPCGQVGGSAQQECQSVSAGLDDFTNKRQAVLGALGRDPSGNEPATLQIVADYLKSKALAVTSFNSLLDHLPIEQYADLASFNPARGFTAFADAHVAALPPDAQAAAKQLAQGDAPAAKHDPGPNGPAAEPNGAAPAKKAQAPAANPQTTAALTAAQTALKGGNTGAALNSLDKVLAQDPNNAPALALRAQAKLAQGDREGALADARQAFALDPNDHMSQALASEIGQLDQAQRKIGGAKLDFGAERAPQDGLGRGVAGQAGLQGWATPTPGAAAVGRPTAAAPTGADGPLVFGPLLRTALRKEAVGDDTGALIDVSQAIDADPKDAAAWTLRAELDLRLGNGAAAISDASRALDLTPSARALRARSYAEYETKLYKQALADATRAVQLDPKNGLGFLYKALAEDKLGLADAESDLRLALALDPTLRRLAAPLLAKYELEAPAATARRALKPWMVRAVFVSAAMALVLIGLLGTQKARTLRAIKLTPRHARADDEPITSGALAPGRMLGGGYRVGREIGRGGMGIVYEAFDERLRRTVAIKRLIRDELTTPDDTARFLREARVVAQLKHPNLAQIYDVAEEGEPFLVFEYVDGEPLDRVLSRAVALAPSAARPLVAQLSAALTYAHGRGVIHRDLKPSNVMVTKDGAVKVMDFGIAHQSRAAATRLTRTIASGTPPYMAPEQAMGSVSKASDLYALGVMTYELLTGRRPFEGPDFLGPKLEKRYEAATKVNPALPAALDHFFESALDPDPTKRPASAAAFMEAFGRACDATPRRQISAA